MIVILYLVRCKSYKALKLTILKSSQKCNTFDIIQAAHEPLGVTPMSYIVRKLFSLQIIIICLS